MSKINRTVIADKDGIIQHLQEHVDQLRSSAQYCKTKKEQNRHLSEAAGTLWAIKLLEDWDVNAPLPPASEDEDRSASTSPGTPQPSPSP